MIDDDARKKKQHRNNMRLVWLLVAIALISMAITMFKGAELFKDRL